MTLIKFSLNSLAHVFIKRWAQLFLPCPAHVLLQSFWNTCESLPVFPLFKSRQPVEIEKVQIQIDAGFTFLIMDGPPQLPQCIEQHIQNVLTVHFTFLFCHLEHKMRLIQRWYYISFVMLFHSWHSCVVLEEVTADVLRAYSCLLFNLFLRWK